MYACRHEYATKAVDFLARRVRLAFLNIHATQDALPKVVALMGDELDWSKERRQEEIAEAMTFLESMGAKPEGLVQEKKNDNVATSDADKEAVLTTPVDRAGGGW